MKAFKGDTAKDPIFIDVGLYGYSPKQNFDPKIAIRHMEQFARDNDGYQVKEFLQDPEVPVEGLSFVII